MTSDAGTTVAGSMQVDAVAPGLFMTSHGESVPAATAVLVESDVTQVPIPVFTCSPSTQGLFCKLYSMPLSTAGDRPIYVSFYATGFRGANAANATCSAGGVPVPVTCAGPQDIPGVDQINIRLLPYGQLANLFYNVAISIDGVMANSPFIGLQ